ncbi:hypothetical protein TNCV_1853681 [Trichonephila clavipes]|nr:hypothetical protein TNCV_1853681 [Trichonephila clavipes]
MHGKVITLSDAIHTMRHRSVNDNWRAGERAITIVGSSILKTIRREDCEITWFEKNNPLRLFNDTREWENGGEG